MPLLFGSYCGTAVPLEVSRYRSMTRKVGAYIVEAILCNPIYMPLLFGSYSGTAVPLEVAR